MVASIQQPTLYSGAFRHALDDKNRVTIPSKWRQDGGTEFFLIPQHKSECVLVMPPDQFRAVGEQVTQSSASKREQRVFLRQFFSRAQQSSIDKQGRLLLPEEFCRQVGLEEEVMLVGDQYRFEVWSLAKWAKFQDESGSTYERVADDLGI